jgi:hypothetical protein
MDLYSKYSDFLSGQKLDVSRRFRDPSVPIIVDRTEYLRQRCIGQKVLHIGCLDHPEIIHDRVKAGTWLHGVISNVSELCVGVDINSRGYELVRKEFGIENIHLLDLSQPLAVNDLKVLSRIHWDLIICPEILEHITNHQQFLQNVHTLSSSNTSLVLTGPNAFHFANFINALRGFESVNSDHKYWFTFYTLSRMLTATGWKPRQLIYYNAQNGTRWLEMLCGLASKWSRMFCSGLILEAESFD